MRNRATVVVLRDGKVLLVKDNGKHHYSLPGGGIKRHESTIKAATRELYEETGLKATDAIRLRSCDLVTSSNKHRVCLVYTNGKPKIQGKELKDIKWWDMKSKLPVYQSVTTITQSVTSRGWN